MTQLIGLDTAELTALAVSLNLPAYRGKQLASWLYHSSVGSIDGMKTLPVGLRRQLSLDHVVGRSEVAGRQQSADGTLKLLLRLSDGELIETVGMPYEDRLSCCVSTQVGCKVGCLFCATGKSGFTRNLTAGEIVDQVLTIQQAFAADGSPQRVSHVVFMGMGEPLLNYHATLKAIRLLNDEVGIAMRHITVSTVGIVPRILDLAKENLQMTLAISLHAPTDELRKKIIPHVERWGVAEITGACRKYVSMTGRRVTFEYCMIEGLNDGLPEATSLAALLRGLNCHVNLIPCNLVEGSVCRPSPAVRMSAFRKKLESLGIVVSQRMERGAGIEAACGQLKRRVGVQSSGGPTA
jgi:23S rRNA (adenine2503-C2)-methyltransferase